MSTAGTGFARALWGFLALGVVALVAVGSVTAYQFLEVLNCQTRCRDLGLFAGENCQGRCMKKVWFVGVSSQTMDSFFWILTTPGRSSPCGRSGTG